MKHAFLIALSCFALSCTALAGDVVTSDREERMKLALDLHDVVHVRDKITADIERYAQRLPKSQREEFMRYIQLKVDYSKLEELSVTYTADTFTVPELKAMLSYYGSPEGQSAEAKTGQYSSKISKDVQAAIDAAIMASKFGSGARAKE